MSTMTITVLETATIFEAEETIYRYDLPGTGIVEGWATAGVVEQAQSQLPDWPDAEITIDADDDVVALLSEAFTGQSVASAPVDIEPAASDPEEEPPLQPGNLLAAVGQPSAIQCHGRGDGHHWCHRMVGGRNLDPGSN